MEGDEANYMYFINHGNCNFVLPQFENIPYIEMELGEMFGLVDILGSA